MQDLTRTSNKLFIHGMGQDYPTHRFLRRHIARCVDSWTLWADHVVGGCDWVDYMYFWDTLMVSHFAIDTEDWVPLPAISRPAAPLRIVHAPNHRAVKGTEAVLRAVAELQAEGAPIELELLEGKPNHEVRAAIAAADLVVDQLVVGWYAMFAIEGMALGKPVVCYLRDDLLRFYIEAGVLAEDEVPLISADVLSIKELLRHFAADRSALPEIGRRGRDYVVARHSVPVIGAAFDRINRAIGL